MPASQKFHAAESPTADDIRAWRARHGITQKRAAELAYASQRSWEGWEAGHHPMPRATWHLLNIININ